MKRILILAVGLVLWTPGSARAQSQQKDARALVERVVERVGGVNGLHARRDIEYTYRYRQPDGSERVSLERYVFDGEMSWARYEGPPRAPEGVSVVVESFDGSDTWVTYDGELVEDPSVVQQADFTRKTAYYWTAMMFKLTDPGVFHEYEGPQTVDGTEYDVVRMTFGEDVGDAQDTYLLYINPETDLVDQFLYTVMDFGVTEPSLKRLTYREVGGLMLPVRRESTQSNWDGEVVGESWSVQTMEDISLDNGFDRALFERP